MKIALSAVALAATFGIMLQAAPAARSAGATYFTSAQAASGAKLYAANCSQCHGAKLEGISAPPLSGPAMKGSQAIGDVYKYMATNMPAGRSGELSAPTYAAIMAFVLKQNGHAAGSTALTSAKAKTITAKI